MQVQVIRACTTHIWTHPVCKGISRLLTRASHDCTHLSDLLTRSIASVALMACALLRLITYGASSRLLKNSVLDPARGRSSGTMSQAHR
jgi:hypothetical protein